MVLVNRHFYRQTVMAKTLGSGKTITFQKALYDGESSIFKEKRRGDNYQFRMWIKEEKKHYQKSLRTDDYDIALEKAKLLTKDLMVHGMSDKRVFSISVEELIERYLDYRKNDIDKETGITRKRWMTLSSQLKHFSLICGVKTKLSDLNVDNLYEYSVLRNDIKTCTASTIRTEKATINHCIQFAYRNKLIHFEKFNFKQIIIKAEAVGKRDTFTDKEYDKLIRLMRTYTNIKNCEPSYGNRDFGKTKNKTHLIKSVEEVQLERLMVRDYVLALANSCLRVGEAFQLKWGDLLSFETHSNNLLVEIRVRWETSKVRKNRIFFCRGGQYFKRLKERQKHTNDEDLVFSMDGKKSIDHRMLRKHWHALMTGIGITNYYERKLTWYSLRHYGITQRVVSGVDLIDISQMAGTSVKHIESTYLKYRKEQSRTAALKSYKKLEGQIKTI
jgi:hypothetical protein